MGRGPAVLALVTISFGVLTAVVFAQTTGGQKTDFPWELSDQVKKDFELADCFQEGDPPLEQQISTEKMNLTTTTNVVLLVRGLGPCLAGADNGPFLIYARFGNNWRKILRADGSMLRPLASMTSGWHDLEILYHSSRSETMRHVYRFSKAEYQEAACEVLLSSTNPEKPERKPCPGWGAK